MDNLPVFYGKCGYRFPDKGKVFGHGAGEGFGKLLAAAASVGLQAVFAQVDGHPEEPGLFMLRAFKGRGGGEKAEHGFLEDIFGVRQVMEIRQRQTEDGGTIAVQGFLGGEGRAGAGWPGNQRGLAGMGGLAGFWALADFGDPAGFGGLVFWQMVENPGGPL